MEIDKKRLRSFIALIEIKREDLENLFSELVRRGEAVEKDRDKFITKGLDNLQKRGRNIKRYSPEKKIIELLHNDTDYIHKYASCFTISPTLSCF